MSIKFTCLAVTLVCLAPVAVAGIEPDFLMDTDPLLEVPRPIENFNPAMSTLWLMALERPEIDMQRMAAETIAQAHQFGIPDLRGAVPRLEQILTGASTHPAARFAAARALIVLESHGSADKLCAAAQAFGADIQLLIEPALATWDDESARAIWEQRLKSSESSPRELVLAIRGLGIVRDATALEDLLSLCTDDTKSASVRLEAAAAAGNIADRELEPRAELLARSVQADSFVDQLCAVRLLARHSSDSATRILTDLAAHEKSAVAAAALQRLNEIDVALVLSLAPSAMQNADPLVRREAAMAMLQRPDAGLVATLGQMLGDVNPRLRRDVSSGLQKLAEQPELDQPIRDSALQMLTGEEWQGQEQAALLLGSLEHKPAADRLVQLLESQRPEVRLASAWALRKVAVRETIPALIEEAMRKTEQRRIEGDSEQLDQEIAHLFEAIGVLHAEEAVSLLREYVPKRAGWHLSRGAAIWAIGKIREGSRDADIESSLSSRILDFDPQPRESSLVKQMSAVALARMQAADQAQMMREFAVSDGVDTRLKLALGWAVRHLTGEELPAPEPLTVSQGNWFLEPLP
ncbi:MAG: HEAT repeat domain-containing protein [Planctomycetaceae bacterium]